MNGQVTQIVGIQLSQTVTSDGGDINPVSHKTAATTPPAGHNQATQPQAFKRRTHGHRSNAQQPG